TDVENRVFGGSPIVLNNNWAPRFGVIYDPTGEGKSKLYGSWARVYESIPLDINNRSFGNEGFYTRFPKLSPWAMGAGCSDRFNPINPTTGVIECPVNFRAPSLAGGDKALVVPDLKGQYTDELIFGGEYEVIEDLSLGGYYTHRNLGTIIEDSSV